MMTTQATFFTINTINRFKREHTTNSALTGNELLKKLGVNQCYNVLLQIQLAIGILASHFVKLFGVKINDLSSLTVIPCLLMATAFVNHPSRWNTLLYLLLILLNDSLEFMTKEGPKNGLEIAIFNVELLSKTLMYIVIHHNLSLLANRSLETLNAKQETPRKATTFSVRSVA